MAGRAKATSKMLANIRQRERLLDKTDPPNEREQRNRLEEKKRELMNKFNKSFTDKVENQ
jgi:hypothetical protein